VTGPGALRSSHTLVRVLACTLLFPALIGLAAGARAQDACDDAMFIHNYPVRNAGLYIGLFEAVEGYLPGPRQSLPWPFAEDGGTRYPTQDYCPQNPDDRLVRLFEVPAETSFKSGTLTLITKDMAAARKAASVLAVGKIHASELKGRSSLYFTDASGNEFFIWAYPGPPSL